MTKTKAELRNPNFDLDFDFDYPGEINCARRENLLFFKPKFRSKNAQILI